MKANTAGRAKRHNEIEINVVKKHGFKFKGLVLPKGSIYGYDKYGAFACRDYRLKGKHGGFYKGKPCLAIFRPDNTRVHCIMWSRNVEASRTSEAIYRYWEEHEELEIIMRPDKDARVLASRINRTKPAFGEVTYRGQTPYVSKPDVANSKRRTTVAITVGHRTLEEIADEQRGKFVFTGTL